jgi:excisionase family DNA binding protein
MERHKATMGPPLARVLEVSDAAKAIGVSTRMMHQLIEAGVIPALRTGRDYKLIKPEDLEGLEITFDEIRALVTAKQRRRGTQQVTVSDRKESLDGEAQHHPPTN